MFGTKPFYRCESEYAPFFESHVNWHRIGHTNNKTTTMPSKKSASIYKGREVVAYNSSARDPFCKFSNLMKAPIVVDKYLLATCPRTETTKGFISWVEKSGAKKFAAAEYLWQCFKALDDEVREQFVEGGRNSFVPTREFFEKISSEKEREKAQSKAEHWAKKDMVGVAAKMAVTPKHHAKLGIAGKIDNSREHLPRDELDQIWEWVLLAKFRQNENFREQLLKTGNDYLLEFDRGAARKDGAKVFWGGYMRRKSEESEDGVLIGSNYMGETLMRVREKLRQQIEN